MNRMIKTPGGTITMHEWPMEPEEPQSAAIYINGRMVVSVRWNKSKKMFELTQSHKAGTEEVRTTIKKEDYVWSVIGGPGKKPKYK